MVKFLSPQGLSTYLNGEVFVPSRFVHIPQWWCFCPLKVCPHTSMVTSSAKIKIVFIPSKFVHKPQWANFCPLYFVHIPQWSSFCALKVCPHTPMVKFLSPQGLSTYLNGQIFVPSKFVHIPQWSNHQPAGCRQVRFSSLTRAHHGQRPIAVEVQQPCYIGQVHKASGVTWTTRWQWCCQALMIPESVCLPLVSEWTWLSMPSYPPWWNLSAWTRQFWGEEHLQTLISVQISIELVIITTACLHGYEHIWMNTER